MEIGASVKVVLTFAVLIALPSCIEPVNNPQAGAAEHISVSHGSIWGGGIELELSRSDEGSSLFEDAPDVSISPHGYGRRAKLDIGIEDFRKFEKSLQSLEEKAFPESEIEERLNGHWTLGYDCENRITDQTVLFVEWQYSNTKKRHAFYNTGCQNAVTKQLKSSYFELVSELRQKIGNDQWFKSTSRNVEETTETE